MNPFRFCYLPILLFAAFPAFANVTVSFPSPTYTDIGPPGHERDDVKNELARHIQALEAKYGSPSDNLWIEVVDVDLAGNRSGGRHDVRVTRGNSDFPQIVVRYKLDRGGQLKTGEDTLRDVSYSFSMTKKGSSEPLYYEKQLLENWFKDRFAQ